MLLRFGFPPSGSPATALKMSVCRSVETVVQMEVMFTTPIKMGRNFHPGNLNTSAAICAPLPSIRFGSGAS